MAIYNSIRVSVFLFKCKCIHISTCFPPIVSTAYYSFQIIRRVNKMKTQIFYLFLAIGLFLPAVVHSQHGDSDDNDFAEFEEFDVDDDSEAPHSVPAGKQSQQSGKEEENDFAAVAGDEDEDDQRDGMVEDDTDEFDHFQDEEEFEGFHGAADEDDLPSTSANQQQQPPVEPKLTMAKVPLHFRTHWDSYYMEMIMLAGILAYFGNYILGRGKNTKIVNSWLATHRALLEDNFVLVGDDGKMDTESTDASSSVGFLKESESQYTLWCSGRTCCEGMLVELKLIKRQDLVSVLAGFMKPVHDQMLLKVELSKDVFDTFVFAVAVKKTATKLFKEQSDLNKFCTLVAKSDDKYKVPAGFSVLSEIPEASGAVLDSRLLAALHKYAALIEYIHISDQYSGAVPPAEDQQSSAEKLKQPEAKRMLMAAFNLPKDGGDEDSSKALLTLVFYLMERLKRYRMSREGKAKAEKNRQRVEEQYLKSTHAARAEAAAQRREDKRKAEKERILAEEDPEKQRRMEAKEQKREAKKKAPRMKKLSIKAM